MKTDTDGRLEVKNGDKGRRGEEDARKKSARREETRKRAR